VQLLEPLRIIPVGLATRDGPDVASVHQGALSTTALAIAAARCDVPAPHGTLRYSQAVGRAAERCASSSAEALHRSPVTFLVDLVEAAAIRVEYPRAAHRPTDLDRHRRSIA
jgi:hypothetical protein